MTETQGMRRTATALSVLLLLSLAAVVGPASPAAAVDCTRTISGVFDGEDGQRIGGFVGVVLFDANLNPISPNVCPQAAGAGSGYNAIDRVNGNQNQFFLGTNGAAPTDTRYENRWEISGLPINTAFVTVEAYPKSANGPVSLGYTDYSRYGGAMRRMAPVSTTLDLHLPVGANFGGDNGAISGRVLSGGAGVAVRAIHAFSRAPDRRSPIMGFMSYPGPGTPDGAFVLPQLEPNQSYALSFEFTNGGQAWYEHDYGTGLAISPRATASYDFTLIGNPAAGNNRVVINEPVTSGPGAVDLGFAHSVSYRGVDGSLRQRVGGSLVPLGGQILGAPDTSTWFNGRLDVVVRGTDNHVYTRTSLDNGASWGGWADLGGQITDSPSIVAWGNGRLDVFATGTDRQLWHRWSTNGSTWGIWEPLGGILTGSVDAASWGPGRLDVVGRGTDGQVYHRFFEGGWQGWTPMGGAVQGGPAIAAPAPGRVDIVVRGTDNRVYIRSYNGGWSNWAWLNGGQTTQDPDAFGVLGRTNVYVTGIDGTTVYRTTRANGANAFGAWGPT